MHNRLTLNTNNILYISLTEIEEGFRSNLHSHLNLEILLFIDGEGYIQTTNNKMAVKRADMVVINKNCNHVEVTRGLKFFALGIDKINISIKQNLLQKIIHFHLNESDYSILLSLYRLIYHENINKNENTERITNNSVDTILMLVSNRFNMQIKETNKLTEDSDLINTIKQLIQNYYYQNLKLDEMANKLSQSKSTICHEFKKHTGMTIMQYKIQKQIEEAKNLLTISDMNISQIASLVGFDSASYFTKVFRQKYGITPKKFKETRTHDHES